MAKLIKERELITGIEYTKEYVWKDDASSGFSFDCDEKGNIDCKYALKNIKLAKENAELRNTAEFQQSSNMNRYFENKKLKEGNRL